MPQFHRISEVSDLMSWKEWLHWPGFAIRVDGRGEGGGNISRLACEMVCRDGVSLDAILERARMGEDALRSWGAVRLAWFNVDKTGG